MLVTLGLLAVVFGLTEAGQRSWSSPLCYGALLAGAAALAGFWAVAADGGPAAGPAAGAAAAHGRLGNSAGLVAFATETSVVFLLTLYLQQVRGYSPLQAGLVLRRARCRDRARRPAGAAPDRRDRQQERRRARPQRPGRGDRAAGLPRPAGGLDRGAAGGHVRWRRGQPRGHCRLHGHRDLGAASCRAGSGHRAGHDEPAGRDHHGHPGHVGDRHGANSRAGAATAGNVLHGISAALAVNAAACAAAAILLAASSGRRRGRSPAEPGSLSDRVQVPSGDSLRSHPAHPRESQPWPPARRYTPCVDSAPVFADPSGRRQTDAAPGRSQRGCSAGRLPGRRRGGDGRRPQAPFTQWVAPSSPAAAASGHPGGGHGPGRNSSSPAAPQPVQVVAPSPTTSASPTSSASSQPTPSTSPTSSTSASPTPTNPAGRTPPGHTKTPNPHKTSHGP